MSVLDKFLSAIKLKNEDELEDEYLDDDDPSYEDDPVPPRRRIVVDREEEVPVRSRFEEEEEESAPQPVTAAESAPKAARTDNQNTRTRTASTSSRRSSQAKISPIRSARRGESSMEVCVIRPHSMEDSKEITDTLVAGCAVVLNVEALELETAQRIIDFASGSCYALDGNLQKISNSIFIITPNTVGISGDFQELLSGAFDVPFEKRV